MMTTTTTTTSATGTFATGGGRGVATVSGWTPKTDSLLLHHRPPSLPPPSSFPSRREIAGRRRRRRGTAGGYDVIDRAFGPSFPPALLAELRAGGWVGGGDSVGKFGSEAAGRLRPARTAAEAEADGLLKGLVGSFLGGDDDGRGSSGGDGGGADGGPRTRGDLSAFVSRDERSSKSFPEKFPMLSRLIGSVEATAARRLGADEHSIDDDDPRIAFDLDRTSVQVARYPGDGASGYPRHCDRGPQCTGEDPVSEQPMGADEAGGRRPPPGRILTFVYYLTPHDWDSTRDGGALRMFLSNPPEYSPDDDDGGILEAHFDLAPYSDRLVAFRSDLIEHLVLPSQREGRVAITVWLYGRVVRGGFGVDASHDAHVRRDVPGTVARERGLTPPFSAEHDDDCNVDNDDKDANRSRLNLPPPLSIPNVEDGRSNSEPPTIFVAIPAYRDAETWPTIKSLVEMAYDPKRITVGVCFQVDTVSKEEVRRLTTAEGARVTIRRKGWSVEEHVRSLVMDCRHATGGSFPFMRCASLTTTVYG
ncbi:hypothetical protein ACHAWF_005419 [Thalassiosira exigua]